MNPIAQLIDPGGEPGDRRAVQERILAAAKEAFGADLCVLFTVNPITSRFLPQPRLHGELRVPGESPLTRPGFGELARRVLAEGVVLVSGLEASGSLASAFSEGEGIKAFAGLALREAHGKPVAMLYLAYRRTRSFSADDRERLDLLARQASSLLQTSWYLARYAEVTRIGSEVNQQLKTIEELFENLDQHVRGILDTSDLFALGIYSWEQEEIRLHYRYREESVASARQPMTGEELAELQKQPKSLSLSEEPSLFLPGLAGEQSFDSQSSLFMPLEHRGIPLGFLAVQNGRPGAYDWEDLRLLELLATHVAASLSSIRLFLNLDRLSLAGQFLTDELEPEQALGRVVTEIRNATRADIVVLFPYVQKRDELRQAHFAGELRTTNLEKAAIYERGSLAHRVVMRDEPLYLSAARSIWSELSLEAPPPGKDSFQAREGIVSTASLPIRARGETAGALFLNYRREQPFDGAQKRLIEGLAVYAAIAIRNARRFVEVGARRAREHAIIQRIDQEIARARDHKTVLQVILDGANELVAAEDAAILLLADTDDGQESPEQRLYVTVAAGEHAAETMDWSTPFDRQSLVGWVFEQKETLLVEDLEKSPRWKGMHVEVRPGTRAELDVPLISDGEVIGVLNFESPRPAAFDLDDQLFVETLANQVVLAIRRAQDAESAEQRARERGLLMELSRQIIGEIQLEELLNLILRKALSTADARAGVLVLHDLERDDLEVRAEEGGIEGGSGIKRIPLDKGIVGHVAREHKMVNVDPTERPWRNIYLPWGDEEVRSVLAVPMLEGKRLWGVINLESPERWKFKNREVRLTRALADLAVIALKNAEAYERAETGRQRLKFLQELTTKIIAQATDPQRVTHEVASRAMEFVKADSVDLVFYSERRITSAYVWSREGGDSPEAERLGAEDALEVFRGGIVEHVATKKKPYRTRGSAQSDRYYTGIKSIESELAVPLLEEEGELLGVLNVESERPFAFDRSDEDLLQLFAGEVIIAIQNARSLKVAETELARFNTLVEVAEALGEHSTRERIAEACQQVAELAVKRCGGAAEIWTLDAKGEGEQVARAGEAFPSDSRTWMPPGWSEGPQSFEDTAPLYLDDTTASCGEEDGKPCSAVMAPLLFGKERERYGWLALGHAKARSYSHLDRRMAHGMAQLLAMTYHRLQASEDRAILARQNQENETMGWVGQASYQLAHRLGNDLAPIKIRAQMIEDCLEDLGIADDDLADYLDRIIGKVELVLDLSARLKEEIKRIQAEGLSPGVLEPQALLAELGGQFDELPEGVRLELTVAPGARPVLAIEEHVHQILYDLVDNALSSLEGDGLVQVEVETLGRGTVFKVIDSGCGISPVEQERIFKFLYTRKNKKTKESGHTGFGLWSAMRKAELNGGALEVESEPGRGSEFSLLLPIVETQAENADA